MDTKIVGFAGKMQSGKDSSCNLLYAIALRNMLKMTPFAEINAEGKIVAEDAEGNRQVLNVDSRHPEFMAFMAENVWPFIRKFSFAEPLKETCQYILGLPEESVWGTNEQKNQLTHLRWEDMPAPAFVMKDGSIKYGGLEDKQFEDSGIWSEWVYGVNSSDPRNPYYGMPKAGFMTGREVMEYFGTQIMRKMYPNVWADALIRRIEAMNSKYATICDVRFPNEVEAIKNAGGKVIRLTLTTEEAANNTHISNTALDEGVYDWNNFDAIIDNQNMTMQEAHAHILDKLIEWDFMKLETLEVANDSNVSA